MEEMFEIGDLLETENEKAELDVLADVMNNYLDYFEKDKDFLKMPFEILKYHRNILF